MSRLPAFDRYALALRFQRAHLLPGRKSGRLIRSLFFTSLLSQTALLAQEATPEPQPSASPDVADEINDQVNAVFKRCNAAVVRIEAKDGPFDLVGSGFFVDPNGTLITSYSVGGKSMNILVSYGGMKYPARRLTADPRSGIALLKVESDSSFPFLMTGNSREMHAPSPIMLIGYPLDFPVSPSLGMLAGFDIRYLDHYFVTTHIRASVPIENGECGAPLVNMKGRVIGIAVAALGNKSGCYALPIEAAEKIRQDYARFGEVKNGFIGVNVDHDFTKSPGSPARVESFVKGAPAEQSGIQVGDVIASVAGHKIESPADLLDASFFLSPGERVAVTVMRDGKELPFTIQAGDPATESAESLSGKILQDRENSPGVILQTAAQ